MHKIVFSIGLYKANRLGTIYKFGISGSNTFKYNSISIFADYFGETISSIKGFGSFLGARKAPTSIILIYFLFLILNMSRYTGTNKQNNSISIFFWRYQIN